MFIVRHLKNWAVQYRTSTEECSQKCGFHSRYARSHTSNATKTLLQGFGLDIIGRTPYAPSSHQATFYLFLHMKSFLRGRCFNTNKELKEHFTIWSEKLAATFCDEGIHNLVHCYSKCLEGSKNSYSKKYCKEINSFAVSVFFSFLL